ncbi:MAG TPA: sigma-70 family RNA polymerase sigma factor [Prosthecobacter sp.]
MLIDGQPGAQSRFAAEVGRWLRSLMINWLPANEDHEQAALDILTEAVAGIDRFDPQKGSFKGWIRCIASRRTVDFYRASQRRMEEEPSSQQKAHRDKFHLKTRLDVPVKHVFLEALASLAPIDHELLRLFFEEHYSDSEVAEALNISPGNARQKKKRLLERLHKLIISSDTNPKKEPLTQIE